MISGEKRGLRLPSIIGDNMVLQQGMRAPVWGWDAPGQRVTVAIAGQKATAKTGADGRWKVRLRPMKAVGPHEMTVTGSSTRTLRNILVGEVWVCSGQSNMQMAVRDIANGPAEVQAANYPRIRLFTVACLTAPTRQDDLIQPATWQECSPQSVELFAAAAYFFGRDLQKALQVPVGLINTSWGGTVCETWMSREALEADAEFRHLRDHVLPPEEFAKAKPAFDEALRKWESLAYFKDPGNKGFGMGWAAPDCSMSHWIDIGTPGLWRNMSDETCEGAVWYRRDIKVPKVWEGKDLLLSLGAIDDFDTTYFNGTQVGAIGMETPNWWMTPRRYTVPGTLAKAGRATIAVRVFDHFMGGGLMGPAPEMCVVAVGRPESEAIRLNGTWKFKVEYPIDPATRPPRPNEPMGPDNPNCPTTLYNSMIHPLIPFGIRGALWYQGESNADRAYQYRRLFPALIRDWRRRWGKGAFPFLFVQLANWGGQQAKPGESDWAELREAQTMALRVPNTGMALAIDIGDAEDMHPRNKQDVGRRLALAARALVYRQKLVYSGPMYAGMTVKGSQARLRFKHVGGGLVARGGKLRGFAIAAKDRKFVWAQARVEEGTVVVWSDEVPKPVAVRYGWADNPDANLYNKESLPAVPFRTDKWPGLTAGKR